ncbi:MAG: hypothetical protein ABIS59_03800 [Candidatus Saccharibacteria bacterium]
MRLARSLKVVFGFAAIGSGSLLLAGTALADTAPASSISVVSTDSTVIVESSSTQLKTETTTVISSLSENVVNASSDSEVGAPIEKADTQVSPADVAQVPATSVATSDSPNVLTTADMAKPIATVTSQPVISASRPSTYAYLTTSFGVVSPTYSAVSLPAIALTNPAQTQASKTPVAPVTPFMEVGTLLSLFANALPVRLIDFDIASLGFALLSLVFVALAGRIRGILGGFVFNFAAWLKETGYLAVTSAGLPSATLHISSSMVMDYVSAPAPYA